MCVRVFTCICVCIPRLRMKEPPDKALIITQEQRVKWHNTESVGLGFFSYKKTVSIFCWAFPIHYKMFIRGTGTPSTIHWSLDDWQKMQTGLSAKPTIGPIVMVQAEIEFWTINSEVVLTKSFWRSVFCQVRSEGERVYRPE